MIKIKSLSFIYEYYTKTESTDKSFSRLFLSSLIADAEIFGQLNNGLFNKILLLMNLLRKKECNFPQATEHFKAFS